MYRHPSVSVPETADPVAALDAKDIPTRAAGTRDLSLSGGSEHLARLVIAATSDKSPGVRFGAAAAAADILSRHRLGPAFAAISTEAREALLRTVSGTDPGHNAGLFQICALLGVSGGYARISAAMRDPRVDVRAGACVGLWRCIASASANGDAELEASVVALLGDIRIQLETRAEIARIAANAGYASALDASRVLLAEATRNVAKVLEEAVARLEAPPSNLGVWYDAGIDAGEVTAKPRKGGRAAMLGSNDGILVIGKPSRGPLPKPSRMLWARAPGAESAGPVMQVQTLTWWPGDGEDVVAIADALIAAGKFSDLDALDASLPQCAASLRLRGSGLLARGDVAGALGALELAVSLKKVPTDTWWYLAEALHRSGNDEEARPHLEKFVGKAGKKAPFVEEAKKRLGAE